MRAAPAVPQACCIGNMLPTSIQVQRRTPGLPCAMALRLIRDRPGDPAFRDTIALKEALAALELDACIGASDPNDFAVRNSALVFRTIASTASHRTFVTIASAPLIAGDKRSYAVDLGCALSGIFSISGLDMISENQK